MADYYYLRVGSDTLDESERHNTKVAAVASFRRTAKELGKYGQVIDATIHIASRRAELAEYPDYVLSVGDRGGVVVERA